MAASDFAFDALAADYDVQFTYSTIGTLMREAIWRRLDVHFHPGQRILELNCGTEADAVYLGRRGVRVLATDLSREMVAITRRKVAEANLADMIEVQCLALEHLDALHLPPMDGALSNFGGLNCVTDMAAVARALARQLRPGARVFLCVIGLLVPWKWVWFLWRRQPGKVWRRLRPGGVAWRGLAIVRPDQVWVSDITYIRLQSSFAYLAVIMDVFTRRIRGWQLGQALDESLTLLALQRALAQQTPEIHHSDQGVQYAATAYTQALEATGAQISMAEVGQAWQNGDAERLMRTIKEEEGQLSESVDYADALRQIGRFLNEVYMHKRIHSALGYLTPAEFEEPWHRAQAQPLDVQ